MKTDLSMRANHSGHLRYYYFENHQEMVVEYMRYESWMETHTHQEKGVYRVGTQDLVEQSLHQCKSNKVLLACINLASTDGNR